METTMTIRLNRREVDKLHELFNQLNTGEWGSVVLHSENSSGIGSILTATFAITHNDIDGEFTVTISDESNW